MAAMLDELKLMNWKTQTTTWKRCHLLCYEMTSYHSYQREYGSIWWGLLRLKFTLKFKNINHNVEYES